MKQKKRNKKNEKCQNVKHRPLVYLTGAGPGDSKLLTIKALEAIQKSDCIVYDYLVSDDIRKLFNKNAEIIYVGKTGKKHTLEQEDINKLIIKKAKQGKVVCRLKGGDPFIFGRGGEEAQDLRKANIDFEIIPGITSAISAPAYAGIPLTHRDFNQSVTILTGHRCSEKSASDIDFKYIASLKGTKVILMGMKNLPVITKKLIENKVKPTTPIAIVRWGTTTKQKVVTGTLKNINEKVRKAKIGAPAIIIIGEIVKLRKEIQWFDNKKLFGKKIVITRSRAQNSELIEYLKDLGASPIECPTIKINRRENKKLKKYIIEDKIKEFDWIIFTSVNGVEIFFQEIFNNKKDVRILGNSKFACIGKPTANKLKEYGIISDILPENFIAESLIDSLKKQKIENKKILIPRASKARTVLIDELKKNKAEVEEIKIYDTVIDSSKKKDTEKLFKQKGIYGITFTSSSTVDNFFKLFGQKASKYLKDVKVFSIGPITTKTLKKYKINKIIESPKSTIKDLILVLEKF